jgi:SPP1 gp7 family putative phage head morphogenesis protein
MHLEHFAGEKMRGINESTQAALGNEFSEGIALGEGIDELADRVSDVFDDAEGYRAERIARTEVVGSSNFCNLRAFEMSGVVQSKEWLSVQDGNTRQEHRQLDGNVVKLHENFTVDGHTGSAPGQFGVAELDINCRCAVLPVVADVAGASWKTAEDRAAVWKRFDRRFSAWERVGVAAFRAAFRTQKALVLEQLRKAA